MGGRDKRGRALRPGPVGRRHVANVGVCAATYSMDRASERAIDRSVLGMPIIIVFATLTNSLHSPPVNAIVSPGLFGFLVWVGRRELSKPRFQRDPRFRLLVLVKLLLLFRQ